MQRTVQQPVASIEAPEPGRAPRLDWDDLRVFLAVADCGSFRAAATELAMQASSVMRRIDQLEHRLDTQLFERLPGGVQLSADGLAILAEARDLKDRFQFLERKIAGRRRLDNGVVTLSVTDGLGTYWIGPRLGQLRRIAPRIRVNLKCSMDVHDVAAASADIGLQYQRPVDPDLACARIARLHIWFYAAKSYLDIHGMPTSLQELRKHRFVIQAANQLDESTMLEFLGVNEFRELDAVRTNTSTSHYEMIRAGMGVGVVPTYLGCGRGELVPLAVGADYGLDIYLTYRQSIGEIARVRTVINWLKTIFDAKAHRYFSDTLLIGQEPRPVRPEQLIDLRAASVLKQVRKA